MNLRGIVKSRRHQLFANHLKKLLNKPLKLLELNLKRRCSSMTPFVIYRLLNIWASALCG
nr:hypothetical protein Iba_chr08bCG9830 [Ipomoea batatas]